MLRNLMMLSAILPMCVCAQVPQLGKDPVEKVVSAMTLDENWIYWLDRQEIKIPVLLLQ